MAAQHQSKLKTKPFFIVSKRIAVLACFIILISLTSAKKWAIDSDCGIGNKWQKVQECDDFGWKPPTFECFQTDDISFSSGFSDDSSSTTKTSTSSGGTTVAHVQEAGTSSTGSGDKRPSRLIIRTQNTEKSILRLDSIADNNLAYEIVMNPNKLKF